MTERKQDAAIDGRLDALLRIMSVKEKPKPSDDLKPNEIIAYPIVLEEPYFGFDETKGNSIFKRGSLDKWLNNPPDSLPMYFNHREDDETLYGEWTDFKMSDSNPLALQAKGTFNQDDYWILSLVKTGHITGASCGFGHDIVFGENEGADRTIIEVKAIHEMSVVQFPKNPLALIKEVSSLPLEIQCPA